ncbi:hypothetical protein [Quatrionicoccus australiensis]|uniref:hypothetical protein n=1 Tax=Quatrionicoccus australiensis TaxID=138118 RepID=UPI001CFC1F78|nr:hypothetical protein [Quatrionicoccus australiensis]MCB4359571.1 hypothetical protein [Quatrionicoccus australiensis]
MKRTLISLMLVGACVSAHAAGSGSWVLDQRAAEYQAECLTEAKALVAAVEADPIAEANAKVADTDVTMLSDFRLLNDKVAYARCDAFRLTDLPADERAFCGVGGRMLMCAAVLQNKLVSPTEMQATYRYQQSDSSWEARKRLPGTYQAVKVALWVARGGEPVDIQKMSMPACAIAGNDTRRNMTGGGPAAGGMTESQWSKVDTCLKLTADDGGVIKAVGFIHPKYAGWFHKTMLDQENAVIYLSRVVVNEQNDARKHPLYPIFEKAAKGQ